MKTLRFFLMTVVVGAVTVGAQSNGQLNFVFNVITSHHLAMYDTLNFVSTGFKSGQDIGSDTMSTDLSRIELNRCMCCTRRKIAVSTVRFTAQVFYMYRPILM